MCIFLRPHMPTKAVRFDFEERSHSWVRMLSLNCVYDTILPLQISCAISVTVWEGLCPIEGLTGLQYE